MHTITAPSPPKVKIRDTVLIGNMSIPRSLYEATDPSVATKTSDFPHSDGDKLRPPPPLTMAKTFVKSAIDWTAKGFAATDEETLWTRTKICGSCEFWNATALRGTGRCMKCGCSTWAKLRMATEKCPIGKW